MRFASINGNLVMEFTGPSERTVNNLGIILGDQLDDNAQLLQRLEPQRDAVLMMEVDEESLHVPSHKQRTALFLSAMRHFALRLTERGLRVRYVRLDDERNSHSFTGEVTRAVREVGPSRLLLSRPGELRVLAMAEQWNTLLPTEILPDRHFLSSIQSFKEWASGRSQMVMEYFYRRQRRALNLLLDKDAKPVGGRWNYDKENRRSFRSAPQVPPPPSPPPDEITREVMRTVRARFPNAPGRLRSFPWRVTREGAQSALIDFATNRLPLFGAFQDAMWGGEPWLYHSLLSPYLNLKLLTVQECLDKAIQAFERGQVPLNSVEAFVRQIIGWREFIRGVYWTEGPEYLSRNALGQTGHLPEFYWTAETDMVCMRESLAQVIEYGYGHHIQRLMVTGNFALISGIEPRRIADWYLAMYVDAVDWVTAPNTLGMVMHADGGIVGTKPYAASGRYIQRMSNYCTRCRYDPSKRTGDGDAKGEGEACPFSTFYWDFLLRNQEQFRSNRRMMLSLRHIDRFSAEESAAISTRARELRSLFGIGEIGPESGRPT